MEKDAFDVAVFYWHTIMTYSSILSIAHTGHCNREYIFKGHNTGQSLRIRKCLKKLSQKKKKLHHEKKFSNLYLRTTKANISSIVVG